MYQYCFHKQHIFYYRYQFEIPLPLDLSILSLSESVSKGHPQSPVPITFTPLMPAELPYQPGMMVALDAEFVTLNNEEAELHSDGESLANQHLVDALLRSDYKAVSGL